MAPLLTAWLVAAPVAAQSLTDDLLALSPDEADRLVYLKAAMEPEQPVDAFVAFESARGQLRLYVSNDADSAAVVSWAGSQVSSSWAGTVGFAPRSHGGRSAPEDSVIAAGDVAEWNLRPLDGSDRFYSADHFGQHLVVTLDLVSGGRSHRVQQDFLVSMDLSQVQSSLWRQERDRLERKRTAAGRLGVFGTVVAAAGVYLLVDDRYDTQRDGAVDTNARMARIGSGLVTLGFGAPVAITSFARKGRLGRDLDEHEARRPERGEE